MLIVIHSETLRPLTALRVPNELAMLGVPFHLPVRPIGIYDIDNINTAGNPEKHVDMLALLVTPILVATNRHEDRYVYYITEDQEQYLRHFIKDSVPLPYQQWG